jgi:hypothetical protein
MNKTQNKTQPLFRFRGKNRMGLIYVIYQVGERFITHFQGNEYTADNYDDAHRFAGGLVPNYARGIRIQEFK